MTVPTFPTLPGITWPAKRAPVWSTGQTDAVSGKTSREQRWTYPRWKYTLAYEFLRSDDVNAELQALVGFYNSVGGSARLFQFADPDDGTVSAQAFGTGDGNSTAFQLLRTFGGFAEPVFAPTGSPTVYVDDVETGVTIGATGLVTFAEAPANGAALTWSGDFSWLCRFDDDSVTLEKFMDKLWQLGQLTFTTEKL